MSDDFARKHLTLLLAEAQRGRHRTVQRLEAACWPGGSADRANPVAMSWLARWHPARTAASLPVCECASGRCPVCN